MTQTLRPPMSLQAPQPTYELTDADRKRMQRISDAWAAYDGLLDKPLQTLAGQPDDNVMTNRMQAVVDRGVDFLFGQELEISVEEAAPKEAQEFLDDVWGRKEVRIPLLQKLAMSGAMAGCAFLRIVPSSDGSFRLVVVDPSIVSVQTAPQDCETVLLYCLEYCCTEKVGGKPVQVYYHEEISRVDPSPDDDDEGYEDTDASGIDADVTWSIQHWSRVGNTGKWTPAGDPIAWQYPFPPLFSCQNLPRPNDFWGTPDVTPDVIGVNKSLNLVQSLINRVNKLYGTPILYATGTGEQVLDIKPGRIIGLPLETSKIVAVPIASDIASALAFADNLRSDIDEQTGVPGVATGRLRDMPRGNVSGVALELLFMPLLAKTFKKRCGYGEVIIEVSKALFALNGMSGDIDVTLAWQHPLPKDDLQAFQAMLIKMQLGVSKPTLLEEAGYDPDEEMARNQAEDAQKLVNFSRGQGFPPALQQQQGQGQSPNVPLPQAGQQQGGQA